MHTILLQAVSDVVCRLWITQLQNRIVVECPVLCLLVLTPDLLALDAKDLHANSSWCWDMIGHDLWCERGVPHDHVIYSWTLEHALSQMWCEIVMYDELAHDTTLCLEMRATKAMHVLIEVHHLKAVELVGDIFDALRLAWLFGFDAFSIPLDSC